MSMSIKEDRNRDTIPVALNAIFRFMASAIYIMSKMEFAKSRRFNVIRFISGLLFSRFIIPFIFGYTNRNFCMISDLS